MRWILGIAIALSIVPVAKGQVLADHVPANATLYVSWKGADALDPAYSQSHLRQFVDSSQVRQFLVDNLPIWLKDTAGRGANNVQIIAKLDEIGAFLWRHPCALCKCESADPTQPQAGGIICDAGADAQALDGAIEELDAIARDKSTKHSIADSIVYISFEGDLSQVDPKQTLATTKDFQSALAAETKDPALVVYLNTTGSANTDLPGLQIFTLTSGFDGKNWCDQILIKGDKSIAPSSAPDGSLDQLIRQIPATATIAGAMPTDFSKFTDDLDLVSDAFNPSLSQSRHKALGQAGIDLQKEFFSSLGSASAYYVEDSQPGVFGPGFLRLILLNHPSNVDLAAADFAKLWPVNANATGPNFTAKAKDGTLFVGASPQFVDAATARASGDSILKNPAFIDFRKRLGAPDKIESFSFYDLPKTAAGDYPMVVTLGQGVLAGAGILDQTMLASILPTPEKLAAALEPAGSVTWTDAEGFHFKALSPFPGAQLLAAPEGLAPSLAGKALRLAAALRPAFQQIKQGQTAVQCMANMRTIDMALTQYAIAHQRNYPPDLATLVTTQDIALTAFICPGSGNSLPPGWQAWTPDQEADWINNHCDYEYLGAGMKRANTNPGAILLRDKDDNHGGELINLAFVDGHVEMATKDRARQLLADNEKLRGKK